MYYRARLTSIRIPVRYDVGCHWHLRQNFARCISIQPEFSQVTRREYGTLVTLAVKADLLKIFRILIQTG